MGGCMGKPTARRAADPQKPSSTSGQSESSSSQAQRAAAKQVRSSGSSSSYPILKLYNSRLSGSSAGFPEYSYEELLLATGQLREVIGEGGFGIVYKGFLCDVDGSERRMINGERGEDSEGKASEREREGEAGGEGKGRGSEPEGKKESKSNLVPVAVKVLDTSYVEVGHEQFLTELLAMEDLRHPNILRLYGYVSKTTPSLIYEFIPNGNVSVYLRKAQERVVEFPWKKRLMVAVQCADALAAIHARNYVHRDFKASNVLLREDLTAVVADFGLARAVDDWKSHVTTRVMGSTGYLDPVYFESGHLNAKCDTYAFGVFLLELLTGLTVVNPNFERIRKQLAASLELPSPSMIVDERIRSQCSKKEALVCLTLSKYAVAGKWDARPDMATILQKLQVLAKGS